MARFCAGFLLFLMISFTSVARPDSDEDKDGLPDEFEQELLRKFAPRFLVSSGDCDGYPAEFMAGNADPRLVEKNGTIYGQVSPVDFALRKGSFIELRYFHLWNRDCGMKPHPLDVEHVSVLVSSATAAKAVSGWKADYWYAAAHQGTICDSSHAARGEILKSEDTGPIVWISAGKHASYLSRELCQGGCGTDDCSVMSRLPVSKIINLGEPGSPLNGATWIPWQSWPLAEKMRITNFPEPVLKKLDDADSSRTIVPVNESQAAVKTAVLVSASTAGALQSADRSTDTALSSTNRAVGNSLKKSAGNTGRGLRRAAKAFWESLRIADDTIKNR